MSPGILLASGGIDSTVLAHMLKKKGSLDSLFFVNYGQASAMTQFLSVRALSQKLDVPMQHEAIVWPEYARGSGFIFGHGNYPAPCEDTYEVLEMGEEEYRAWQKNKYDFIEGRNLEFFTRAGMWARHRDVSVLYTAFQFDKPEWEANPEGSWHNDTSVTFIDGFNLLARTGCYSRPIRAEAPFLNMQWSKEDIVRQARHMRISLAGTYSCEFHPACGTCRPCIVRRGVLDKR